MDPMQEWPGALRLTLLVDMVHHRAIRMGSSLRPSCFDHKRRIDYRDRNKLMMSDLDARKALRDRSGTQQRRSTDANHDGKETAGGILNGLLHVLAEVMHLCRLSRGAAACRVCELGMSRKKGTAGIRKGWGDCVEGHATADSPQLYQTHPSRP